MTPAIQAAKKHNISYKIHQYEHDTNAPSYGEEAAIKLGVNGHQVFKTLVLVSSHAEMAVAVVPVANMLNMKQMAKALGFKKVTMADKHAVTRSTGYVLGGVSPLGQKKRLKTVIDTSSLAFASIFVSAGQRGLEIELSAKDLAKALEAVFADICAE